MYTIEDLKDFVLDKDILIIGNGAEHSILPNYIIVRMNAGVIEGCDIWVDGISYLSGYRKLKIGKVGRIVRLDKLARNTEKYPGYILPHYLYKEMCENLVLQRPSTGMMSLWFFNKFFPDNKKIISGFNGDYNRYSGKKNVSNEIHDWAREREILQELIDGKVYGII